MGILEIRQHDTQIIIIDGWLHGLPVGVPLPYHVTDIAELLLRLVAIYGDSRSLTATSCFLIGLFITTSPSANFFKISLKTSSMNSIAVKRPFLKYKIGSLTAAVSSFHCRRWAAQHTSLTPSRSLLSPARCIFSRFPCVRQPDYSLSCSRAGKRECFLDWSNCLVSRYSQGLGVVTTTPTLLLMTNLRMP